MGHSVRLNKKNLGILTTIFGIDQHSVFVNKLVEKFIAEKEATPVYAFRLVAYEYISDKDNYVEEEIDTEHGWVYYRHKHTGKQLRFPRTTLTTLHTKRGVPENGQTIKRNETSNTNGA